MQVFITNYDLFKQATNLNSGDPIGLFLLLENLVRDNSPLPAFRVSYFSESSAAPRMANFRFSDWDKERNYVYYEYNLPYITP